MDVTAVKRTQSYRRWLDLPDGASFTYNQTFVRGGDGHDWLVRKSIWGRMRYQRKNCKKVSNLRARRGVVGGEEGGGGGDNNFDVDSGEGKCGGGGAGWTTEGSREEHKSCKKGY